MNIHKSPAMNIIPQPTEGEVAAILAAYEALLPHPTGGELPASPAPHWRFSGRWWTSTRYQRSLRQR
ncbi:hypothetical protein [Candidatus Poriferisocius sp.]|uniref:hypothetical protein n=1 Tax=Candidatus Poriferisocius sp. TaxID=3101276 RepID=UPI003B0138E9